MAKDNFELGFEILGRALNRVLEEKHITEVEITAHCNTGGIKNYSTFWNETGISCNGHKICGATDNSDKAVRLMHYAHNVIKKDRYTGPIKVRLKCSGGVVYDSSVVEERS